jgi:hypothetical protein
MFHLQSALQKNSSKNTGKENNFQRTTSFLNPEKISGLREKWAGRNPTLPAPKPLFKNRNQQSQSSQSC